MAPRAKTNRERILEEQALLPEISKIRAPREIEVRADGSEYLGGRQLAAAPQRTGSALSPCLMTKMTGYAES